MKKILKRIICLAVVVFLFSSSFKANETTSYNVVASDEIFANFRNAKLGKIKANFLYRGASPIDNSMGRAKYACKLIEEKGVKFDVNLNNIEKNDKEKYDILKS